MEYSVTKLDFIPSNIFIFSACYYGDYLFAGMAYKGDRVGGPDGAIVIDLKSKKIDDVGFKEIGSVYFIRELNNMLVVGGREGIIIWPRGEMYNVYNINSGINTVSKLDNDTLIIGGDIFVGIYDHINKTMVQYDVAKWLNFPYDIMGIAVLPECLVFGRDISKYDSRFAYPSALCVLDKWTKERTALELRKMDEKQQDKEYSNITGTDNVIAIIKKHIAAVSPTYVQDLFYWKGWLIVIEFKRTYCVRIADGRVAQFSKGGLTLAQNPIDNDEFWVGSSLMIIKYDEKTETWIEDAERSTKIQKEIKICAGLPEDSGLFVSTIASGQKEFFIGTEGQGTFLIKIL